MKTCCSHHWIDCTEQMRDTLRLSEYGGWQVDRQQYYICSSCLRIDTRIIYNSDRIKANLDIATANHAKNPLKQVA